MSTIFKPIVLTRPAVQAQPLADRLTALGYSVTLFPLFEIAPLPKESELHLTLETTLANLSRYAMAVFVSPNAVHAVFKNGLVWPAGVPIAIMGEGSRVTLLHYGVNEINTPIYCPTDPFRSDSEALLQELDLPLLKNREVVIFRAETGRELLAEALAERGIRVVKVVCYRRFAPPMTKQRSQLLNDLLASNSLWVINSSEALRTLFELAADDIDVVALQQMNVWVSHRRIAEIAEKCGFKHIRLIGSGDESLVLALQSHSAIKA